MYSGVLMLVIGWVGVIAILFLAWQMQKATALLEDIAKELKSNK